jgi:photosystem II stability/assembly factor-like uncharacterized protein
MNIRTIIIILLLLTCSYCSEDNNITKTKEWEVIYCPTNYGLTDIEFFNNDFGIICGSLGTLLKTENGGIDWIPLSTGVNSSFMKVFILNEDEFFTSRLGLYKTNNGGSNFSELGDFSNYFGSIFEIHFFNSEDGLIYKDGLVIKTNNGGVNWDTVYYDGGYIDKMQFVSKNIGFIAGGATYDDISYGELHKTVNGGDSWTDIGMSIEIKNWDITGMYFISEVVGFITNYNRELYITKDGGTTWNLICDNLPDILWDMVFLTQDEGYGMGHKAIHKTTDGGITWIKDYKDSTLTFSSITKTPDEKIFIVGNQGIILKKEKE